MEKIAPGVSTLPLSYFSNVKTGLEPVTARL